MNFPPEDAELLCEREAAKILKLKNHRTLSVWRSTKRYNLPYIKIGSNVRYRFSDLCKLIETGRVET